MEYELIESLLIDKQMGNLSDQSAQLLNQYISEHEGINDLDNQFKYIFTLSKNAFESKCELDLPQFPLDKLTDNVKVKRNNNITKISSIAALIALIFWLGVNLGTTIDPEDKLQTKIINSQTPNIYVLKNNSSHFPQSYFENLKKLRIDNNYKSIQESYSEIFNKYSNKKQSL